MFHNFDLNSGGDGDRNPPLTGVCDDVGRIMGYAVGPKFQWSKCANQHFEDHFTVETLGPLNVENQIVETRDNGQNIVVDFVRKEDPITGAMRIIVKNKEDQDESLFDDWCLPAGNFSFLIRL